MNEDTEAEGAQEIFWRSSSRQVQLSQTESVRAISRYGWDGFGDTSLGRMYGIWWLVAAVAVALVPDVLDGGGLLAFASVVATGLLYMYSRLPGSLRQQWRRITGDDEQATPSDRALVFAKLHVSAVLLLVAGWLVVVASERGLLSWPDPAKTWMARIWLLLAVLSVSAYVRQDELADLMSEPDVWNMEDDTSYHSRRMYARFVDIGMVSVSSAILVGTDWWDRVVPSGGFRALGSS